MTDESPIATGSSSSDNTIEMFDVHTHGSPSNEDVTETIKSDLEQHTAEDTHSATDETTSETFHAQTDDVPPEDIHPAANGDPTEKVHKCVEGNSHHPWLQFISQWYLLLLHACYSLAFALAMIYWLDGTDVAVSDNSITTLGFMMDGTLTQPAVTTFISVCLVIARIFSSSWQGLAAWRCVFILLEKYELSLCDISRLVSFRLPPLSVMRPSRPGSVTLRSIMIFVLLLAWPCQFANPIASGSISWIPTDNYTESILQLPMLPTDTSEKLDPWHWFIDYATVREGMIQRSAGYASMVLPWSASQGGEQTIANVTSARRVVPKLGSRRPLTHVLNSTVPVFEIDSFEWVDDVATLPEGILQAITNASSGYLTVTDNASPIEGIGTITLLRESPWEKPSYDAITLPHIVSDKRYAAIFVSRSYNGGESYDYDCRRAKGDFDPLPNGIALVNKAYDNDFSNCIAIAELQITAGVTRCQHAPAQNSSCLLSAGIITSKNQAETILPDPLVTQVLALMPEVQALVEALVWHDPNRQHGRLEARLRSSLVQAYQATWSELTEWISGESQADTTVYEPDASLLRARVSPWRMMMWLATNLLLVVSGLLLLSIQSTCKGKTVNDSVVAAFLLDCSEVIESDDTGLCNATDIGKGHGNTDLKVFLRIGDVDAVGDSESGINIDEQQGYVHPKLMPKL